MFVRFFPHKFSGDQNVHAFRSTPPMPTSAPSWHPEPLALSIEIKSTKKNNVITRYKKKGIANDVAQRYVHHSPLLKM
jgi:hypothetical protein